MYRDHWRYKAAYPYCDIPVRFYTPNEGQLANFAQNWLSWQRPLRNRKNWS